VTIILATYSRQRRREAARKTPKSKSAPSIAPTAGLTLGRFTPRSLRHRGIMAAPRRSSKDRIVDLQLMSKLLSEKFGRLVVSRLSLRVLVFDHKQERVLKWIE
jgi:hypothetical protein